MEIYLFYSTEHWNMDEIISGDMHKLSNNGHNNNLIALCALYLPVTFVVVHPRELSVRLARQRRHLLHWAGTIKIIRYVPGLFPMAENNKVFIQ